MELAVDAAQSRRLPAFLARFADRTSRMLSADWCGVMVFRGRETDFYQASQNKFVSDPARHTLLIQHGRELSKEIRIRTLDQETPLADGSTPPNAVAIFVPITASDAEDL